jgi:hypothetical protein
MGALQQYFLIWNIADPHRPAWHRVSAGEVFGAVAVDEKVFYVRPGW